MAKPKQVVKKQDGWKDARIKANAVRRSKQHATRMQAQALCPKRGLARALRRWCDGASRDAATVLKLHRNLSSLVRSKPKHRERKPQGLLFLIGGKPMGSVAEAMFTVREMAERRKAEQHQDATTRAS